VYTEEEKEEGDKDISATEGEEERRNETTYDKVHWSL
jgi:hypothetical protein